MSWWELDDIAEFFDEEGITPEDVLDIVGSDDWVEARGFMDHLGDLAESSGYERGDFAEDFKDWIYEVT